MPKVTMYYQGKFDFLADLGHEVRTLVAKLASTPSVPLTENDVDWIPQSYPVGSIAPLSFEIETIGFPDRIEKFSREAVLKLKEEILALENFFFVLKEQLVDGAPLIWIKFQDPRGVHV